MELNIRLVDLINQQNDFTIGVKGVPKLALLNIVRNVFYALITQLAVAQTAHCVVFIQTLLGACGGFHRPFQQRQIQSTGDLTGKLGFACSRLTLDEKGTLQRDRSVHCNCQVFCRNVIFRAVKPHQFAFHFITMPHPGTDAQASPGGESGSREIYVTLSAFTPYKTPVSGVRRLVVG